jgi:hypothetical protein
LPASGFALGPTAAGAFVGPGGTGEARKTVVVELESVQPVSWPIPTAATPPSRAHPRAIAARGPTRTAVAL